VRVSGDVNGVARTLLCAAWAALAAGCGGGSAPVTIAAVGNWEGPEERALRQGIELAVAGLGDSGVDGRPVRIVFRDDHNDNDSAAMVAAELVADPTVLAVIGHTRSDPTLVAMKVYDGVMPVVTARFTSPDVSGLSRWVFQLVPTDSAYSAAVVRFAAARDWRTAALVFNNTARGRATAEQFKLQFPGEVLSMDPATFPQPLPGDMRVFVQYHRSERPDLVFLPIGAERAPDYIRAAQAEGLGAAVIGWDVWASVTSDASLPGEFYRLIPFDLTADRPEVRRFAEDFEARYGAAPDPFAALGYDAVGLLGRAARGCRDRACIRDAIASLSPARAYPGVIGTLSFAADGTPIGPQPVVVALSSRARSSRGS